MIETQAETGQTETVEIKLKTANCRDCGWGWSPPGGVKRGEVEQKVDEHQLEQPEHRITVTTIEEWR